jgi:hypothetical protein
MIKLTSACAVGCTAGWQGLGCETPGTPSGLACAGTELLRRVHRGEGRGTGRWDCGPCQHACSASAC